MWWGPARVVDFDHYCFLNVWVEQHENSKSKVFQYFSGFKGQQIQTLLFPIFNILGKIGLPIVDCWQLSVENERFCKTTRDNKKKRQNYPFPAQ